MDNNVGSTFVDERAYRETEVLGQQFTVIDEQATKRGPQRYNYLLDKNLRGQKGVYHIDSYFSEGGEAVLFKCSNAGNVYIAKIYDNRNIVKVIDKDKRQNFINLLYNNSNPSIVSLEDYGRYDDMEFDIYPYLKNGDILCKKDMSIDYMSKVLVPQINEAFKYIHDKGIVHRDINPRNILLSDNENIMLHDFSILSVVGKEGGAYTYHADTTFGYAAPEILSSMPHIKSDYYSLGITLLCLLNGGKDIYDGLNQGMIRQKTAYDKIPGIDREYFKNKDHNLADKDKLLGLIHGLTILDVNNRWGYEEVCKWCKGELFFPLHVAKRDDVLNPPFPWAGKMCNTLEDMAIAIAEDWDDAKVANLRGTFTEFLVRQKPYIKNKLDNILETNDKKIDRQDTILFQTIYTLAPNLPHIYWRGVKHNDFASIAIELNNNLLHYDESFIVLLKDKILSDYIKNRESADNGFVVNDEIKRFIAELEEYSNVNAQEAYNMFIMRFLPMDATRTFIVNNVRMSSVSQLVDYIECRGIYSADQVNDILFNSTFAAWNWMMGYYDYYLKAIDDIKQKDIDYNELHKSLMILLDCISEDDFQTQLRIRNYVLNSNKIGHIFYLKNNLGLFNFYNDGINIRNNINSITLDVSTSVNQLYKNIDTLKKLYDQFTNYIVKNPFDLVNGVYIEPDDSVWESRFEQINDQHDNFPNILPKNSLGCFVYQKDNVQHAAGYVFSQNDRTGYISQAQKMMSVSNSKKDRFIEKINRLYNSKYNENNSVYNTYYRYNVLRILYCVLILVALIGWVHIVGIGNKYVYIIGIVGLFYPIVQIVYESVNIKKRFQASKHIGALNFKINSIQIWDCKSKKLCEALYSSVENMNEVVSLENLQYDYINRMWLEYFGRDLENPKHNMLKIRKISFGVTGIVMAILTYFSVIPAINYAMTYMDESELMFSTAFHIGYIVLLVFVISFLISKIETPRYLNILLFPIVSLIVLLLGIIVMVTINQSILLIIGVAFVFYIIKAINEG